LSSFEDLYQDRGDFVAPKNLRLENKKRSWRASFETNGGEAVKQISKRMFICESSWG